MYELVCYCFAAGDTLPDTMTDAQLVGISGGGILVGGGLLAFLVFTVPPQMPDGEPNTAALIMALISAMLVAGGLGTLIFRVWQRRRDWLASHSVGAYVLPQPEVAIRQGALFAAGVGIILTLIYFQILDAAYFVVVILILVLFEAFVQSRE